MLNTKEPWSAGGRSQGSGTVAFVGTIDGTDIRDGAAQRQRQRVLSRVAISPSVAAVIAAHAYGGTETWGDRQ